jgi:Holliday junction resolvase
MKSEQQLQYDIQKYLKANGYYVFKVVRANVAGIPDIICCKDGRFGAIEVKREGRLSDLKPHQAKHLERIEQAGGISICTDNLETVKGVFK